MNMQFQPPRHPKCGAPAQSYIYRNAEGRAVLIANRYNKPDGGKFFLPFDVEKGDWKAPDLRPIYNLDKIMAANAATPVIFVEGEKCADALTGLGFLTTTSFGGSNAANKTDLSPLFDRTVYLWPDFDEAGESYTKALKSTLGKSANVTLYHVPISLEIVANIVNCPEMSRLPRGWDAADAVSQGWREKDVESLLKHAKGSPQTEARVGGNLQTLANSIQLWHTPERDSFATFRVENHTENWSLDSAHFRNLLSYTHFQAEGKMLSQSALEDKRRTMAGEALFDGKEHKVFTRIGADNGDIYLDLGNKEWSCIKISSEGWTITPISPARFQRAQSSRALPTPITGPSDINLLRPFLNVATDDDFKMLVAWLLGCFQPKGPYPILILSGEQGSAKSTTAQILRSLIDPANPMARSAPQSEQDLVIAARHNHVLSFDNLSYIKPTLADALCRIATGGGFGTRKLHTNSEEVLFDATRPCLLNGIPDLASRPDLADRSIIVSLPVISEADRQYEDAIWDQFNAVAPRILASLLNATSTALARRSSVQLAERPRMADFTRWITAAEPALGWPDGAFLQAYTANRKSVDSAAIEGNPVAEAILTMITDHGPWKGTATDLIRALRRLYPMLTDDPLSFPRQPNKMASALKRVQPLLRRQSVTISKERQGKTGQRVICIKHG